ncbi:MAG TPA: hypothetical protein DEP51_00950 [Clostridiales bacterium]|nr:hypothetical protein [Clostridiales bacterium]
MIDEYLKKHEEEVAFTLLKDAILMHFLTWPDIEEYIKDKVGFHFSMNSKIDILKQCIDIGLLELSTCKSIINLPKEMTIGIEIESVGQKAWLLNNYAIEGWTPKEERSILDDTLLNGGVEYVHTKFYRK